MQLASTVSSAHARGQLIEALALALASCPDLDTWRASSYVTFRVSDDAWWGCLELSPRTIVTIEILKPL